MGWGLFSHYFSLVSNIISMFSRFFIVFLIIMFSITQLNPASIHTQTELKPSSNHMVVCLWFSYFLLGGWVGWGLFSHYFSLVSNIISMFSWFFIVFLIIMFSITQLNPASIHTQTELKPSSNHMVVCLWFS